ncbi:MAG: DUF2804 domain-containing protein [Candidatus Alcyoniella australis]|nr:DUF2804 domain-containing protein [Candidatus Alcyoniella australis]
MREIKRTPQKIVTNGQVNEYGVFRTPFRTVNLEQIRLPGVPASLTRMRLKRWQHYALIGQDFLMAFVVLNARYMSTSFCYFLDRTNGRMVEHHREALGPQARVASELWNGRTYFKGIGYKIEIHNNLEQGLHRVKIDVSRRRGKPAISADLELVEDLERVQPLIPVLPISENRPLYTHKVPCPVRGEIRIGDRRISVEEGRDVALIDVQGTFYPRETAWHWATFAGRDPAGRLIGANLVQNMIEDDERYNENALWVEDCLSLWGAARFEFDPEDVMSPWTIRTTDELCDLRFEPQGERAGKINLGLLKSDYHQPFGTFSGRVVDAKGREHKIERMFGVTEYHTAKF